MSPLEHPTGKTHGPNSTLPHPPETASPYLGDRKLGVIQVIFLSPTSHSHLTTNPAYHPYSPKTSHPSLIFTATKYYCSKFLTGLPPSRMTSTNLPRHSFKELLKNISVGPQHLHKKNKTKQKTLYLVL